MTDAEMIAFVTLVAATEHGGRLTIRREDLVQVIWIAIAREGIEKMRSTPFLAFMDFAESAAREWLATELSDYLNFTGQAS